MDLSPYHLLNLYINILGRFHANLSTMIKAKHIHPGDRPPVDALECCGVHHIYPPPG